MPANPRVRGNNAFGVVSDNPLAAGATAFNSAQLIYLPTISGTHAIITLDPIRQFGDPEIIVVTNHTPAGTIATITRGAYGTTARSHPAGTVWVHAAVNEDFIQIVTSATRPLDPYEGQFIFESDTNKLVGYGGVDWAPRDAGGVLGFAQVTAPQGGITTITDLTGLSVSVTVGTGRRINITARAVVNGSAASTTVRLDIREGGTTLQEHQIQNSTNAGFGTGVTSFVSLSPSAGAHTYKLSLALVSGAGSVGIAGGATIPAQILVEDIGAA